MTPLERAERAKQLLDDPVFAAAMQDVRMRLVAQLEAAPLSDVDIHHNVAISLSLLSQIRGQFARYAAEIEVDKHREQNETWIARMREKLA